MIYVPDLNFQCYSVIDKDTIRAYYETPELGNIVDYRDYFINSHYIYTDGIETISVIPQCIESTNLTNEVYYRNDFVIILIMFVLLSFICFYIPSTIFMKLFKKKGV